MLRSVVFGIAGILLAGTAIGQTVPAQPIDRNIQPYAPLDTRGGTPQAYSPQDFRAAPRNGYGAAPAEIRNQQPPPVDYRQPQSVRGQLPASGPVLDQRPVPGLVQGYPSQAPVYRPQNDARPQDIRMQDQRGQDPRAQDNRAQDNRAGVQDFRNPAGAMRAIPGVQSLTEVPRAGLIDPRVVVPRKEEYIDYKVLEGRAYDFRPADYKAVDTRALDYRSQDNRTPDQRVLDPRLKEKGPEIQAALDCRAIQYRSVECNLLDYREIDPQLADLFGKYPEVAFGIVPKEFAKDIVDRWQPLLAHISAQIGLKFSLKIANDYQALAEAQRAGLVHVAIYSPMAYARARAAGVKVDAFAVETNADGGKGAHSVLYAMTGSGAPRGEEIRGKSVGMVDPNSISGFFVPRMMLAAQKIDADTQLGKQVFTGSHENALLALSQGLVDIGVGEWRSEEDSTLARLLARGTLRHADGTPLRRDDFRVIAKSDLILNAPIAYLADLPDDLKALIRRAMLEAPMRDRAAFERVYEAKGRNWDAVEDKAYNGAIDLVKYMDDARARMQSAALSRQQTAR